MKNGAPHFRPDSRGSRFPMVKTGKNYCLTPLCRGLVNKKNEHSPYCTHCRLNRFREKFPLKYSFGNLRRRAKQRGKDFSLTYEQYEEFAIKTDYARLKGKSSLSLSIDRKNNDEGYHFWNIRAITLQNNTRKQFVPFFANQTENLAYKPSDEEIFSVQNKMSD